MKHHADAGGQRQDVMWRISAEIPLISSNTGGMTAALITRSEIVARAWVVMWRDNTKPVKRRLMIITFYQVDIRRPWRAGAFFCK